MNTAISKWLFLFFFVLEIAAVLTAVVTSAETEPASPASIASYFSIGFFILRTLGTVHAVAYSRSSSHHDPELASLTDAASMLGTVVAIGVFILDMCQIVLFAAVLPSDFPETTLRATACASIPALAFAHAVTICLPR